MNSPSLISTAEVIALASALVAYDTSNPPGNEEPALQALGAYLTNAGLQVHYQPVAPNRANLIARLPGRARFGSLVFSGHIDVVPATEPDWQTPPFIATQIGENLFGRGTADMKGGVAAMATALTHLARSGFTPSTDIILIITSGEERGMPGAKLASSSHVLDGCAAFVIGEPTGLDLCTAEKGFLNWTLRVHGKAAHSSQPHLGINAISFMARLIAALESTPLSSTPHPILQHPTLTITLLNGGVAHNVIPPLCTALINVRTVSEQSRTTIEHHIQRLIEQTRQATSLPVNVTLELESSGPVVEIASDHPLVQSAVRAITTVCGTSPRLTGFTGGTEAKIYVPAYQAPAIILGPGHLELAHQTNEFVPISELASAANVYLQIARNLLST